MISYFHKEAHFMNNEFGPNFITLTDDEGNNIDLEYVDALELDGQTILTLVNFPLDDMHPAQELDMFQFSIADVRLVPYKTPSNVKDNK